MGFLDVPVRPGQIAGKVDKGSLVLNVRDYGAKGDGVTDDTAAIQAAINAATPGSGIYFPGTGSGAWYKTTDTLTVTTPNLRFLGNPRDIYAGAIKCTVPGKTILAVKAPSFVAQYFGLIGDGATNGAGATVNGIELFGDNDGNLDANLWNASFLYMAVCVRIRGRNATVSHDTLFSNSLKGVVIDGKDAVYHTGPAADQNRGNTIRDCRFHNIGNTAADSHIELTANTKVLHMLIAGNYFDSNGKGVHVRATGTSAVPHERISLSDNKHTELSSVSYSLTYVNNSTINGANLAGDTIAPTDANAIELNNCNTVAIRDVFGVQINGSGVYARNTTSLLLNNVAFRVVGYGSGPAAHGFDIDSTNTACAMDTLRVENADGWGFTGSPADSTLSNHEFRACTLGNINSTTLHSRASRGRNVYIEGTGGRKQDYASKSYDLTVAAGATTLATIASANNFSSFEVEVKVIGRNTAGNLYARYVRYVRPENGTPQYVTPVADVAQGTITLAFTTAGTTGVNVTATVTGSDAYVTAHVTALAGGGAATGNARGVTVAMA